VERRDQLRRRHLVHLRRPDHHPDPGHLPEVLRHQDDAAHLGIFYATMVLGRLHRRVLFGGLGLIPTERRPRSPKPASRGTTPPILNIVFLLLAAALLVRFFRSGGRAMLTMMGGSPDGHH
jgi:hypothetical protein